MSPQVRAILLLGAGGVAGAALLVASWVLERKEREGNRRGAEFLPLVPKGRVFCPAEENRRPYPATQIHAGDLVILLLMSADAAAVEKVWARVLTKEGSGMQVQLTPQMAEIGIKPLDVRHGFKPGEILNIQSDCAYDRLAGTEQLYTILCGGFVQELGYDVIADARLARGDIVTIVVGNKVLGASALPGQLWHEDVRVAITSTGATGDIIRGLVFGDLELADEHGLYRNAPVTFTRDCIVAV